MGRYKDTEHRRSRRSKIRRALVRRYGSCAVTGYKNALEYQSAHIIPKSVGYRIGFEGVDSMENCILLSNGLHALFDNFVWCFDVFTFLDLGIGSEDTFRCTIMTKIPPKEGTSCICPYLNKILEIPTVYLPNLYVQYLVYLRNNYHTDHEDNDALYTEYLGTAEYRELCGLKGTSQFRDYFMAKRAEPYTTTVLSHRETREQREYKVLWRYWSYSHVTWEPEANLATGAFEVYSTYLECLHDPTWR